VQGAKASGVFASVAANIVAISAVRFRSGNVALSSAAGNSYFIAKALTIQAKICSQSFKYKEIDRGEGNGERERLFY
jgi:hypothetical protein